MFAAGQNLKNTNNFTIKMFFTGQKSIIKLLGKNHHNDYEKVLFLAAKLCPLKKQQCSFLGRKYHN